MQRPPRRSVEPGSPTGISQRGLLNASPNGSTTEKVKDWVNANPTRTLALVAAFLVTLALLLTASKTTSSRLASTAEEEKTLNELVDPGTKVKDSAAPVRAKVLDETEKIQGFTESYPTYELADDVTPATLSENEADEVAEKAATVISKTELEEEKKNEVLHHIRYIDQKQYDAAPYIKVPPAKPMRNLWWGLKPYESYYAQHPLKWYVPRLDPSVKLTPEMFHEHYRRHAMPVIINSESLRHLGYRTRAWSFDELRKVFPYNETKAFTIVKDYRANSIRRDDEEIDLGPGLASILRDEKLAKQGALRNYPRNLHIKREALAKLEVDYPPLISGGSTTWQLPTLWLGTSTADTPFHHDCCDNFVVMIAGVKRITLAPTTDWRTLSPICSGPNKSLCWAKVVDPNKADLPAKSQEIMSQVHKIVVELKPGEILYMPAGWFHHIKNLGPTVMVNHWTRNLQQVGLVKVLKEAA